VLWAVLVSAETNLCKRFRAAIRFYNGLLSSESALLSRLSKQTLSCQPVVPWTKTSQASNTLRTFEILRGCDTYILLSCRGALLVTQIFLFIFLFSDFRIIMTRKVWRDIANMNPLESVSKLVTDHSWFACPLLDLQAGSRTHLRSEGAPEATLLSVL